MNKDVRRKPVFDYLPFITQRQLDDIGLRNIDSMNIPDYSKNELRKFFDVQ